jgi:deoxyribonuclease V
MAYSDSIPTAMAVSDAATVVAILGNILWRYFSMSQLHSWSLSPDEAVTVQAELCSRLILSWDDRQVETIGGVDVDLEENIARAAIVILRLSDLKPLEGVTADAPLVCSYIPGLLAFREGPAVLPAWEKVQHKPDMVMFDGQGIAHPRGIGIASQMRLWLERPTVEVAKSRLYGRHAAVGSRPGDHVDLYDERDPQRVNGACCARAKAPTRSTSRPAT